MEVKKLTRSTNVQLKKLTEYMSLNPAFANGEFRGPLGSRKMEAQWYELKDLLKEYGPDKTIEQWKQCWRDLKRKARHANARTSAAVALTGNPNRPIPNVSEMSTLILNTIGHEHCTRMDPRESGSSRRMPLATSATEAHLPYSPNEVASSSIVVEVDPLISSFEVGDEEIVTIDDNSEDPSSNATVNALPQMPQTDQYRGQTPRHHRRRQRNRNAHFAAFLELQREQNNLLKRLCDSIDSTNNILREQSRLKRRRKSWAERCLVHELTNHYAQKLRSVETLTSFHRSSPFSFASVETQPKIIVI